MTGPPIPPNSQHPTYPVHMVITGKPCLVVGAGPIAARKAAGLLAAGARVTAVAPEIHPEVEALTAEVGARLGIERRRYRSGEVAHYRLAITCTNDPAVNRQVFIEGERYGIWVNSADDPANCAFILPSVARQGDLAVSVSTNGRSPALATWLRRRFESEFDHHYGELLDLLADVRQHVRRTVGSSERPGWNEALDSGVLDMIRRGDRDTARQHLLLNLGVAEAEAR